MFQRERERQSLPFSLRMTSPPTFDRIYICCYRQLHNTAAEETQHCNTITVTALCSTQCACGTTAGWVYFTVEPLNKGHFGANSFVPCREVVPISEVK